MGSQTQLPSRNVTILLADTRTMQNQLLSEALRRQGFTVLSCRGELGAILPWMEKEVVDVLVASVAHSSVEVLGMKTVQLTAPRVAKIVLLDRDDRDAVVQAFRAGVRGIFCLMDSPLAALCECIERVHRGEIWASSRHLGYLLDSVCQTPTLQVWTSAGDKLLTSREEQVVALVADGLSNRNIAGELGLSEHTVKKYLFRIFEKLGISNRVELVLYAVHHGEATQPEWVASA